MSSEKTIAQAGAEYVHALGADCLPGPWRRPMVAAIAALAEAARLECRREDTAALDAQVFTNAYALAASRDSDLSADAFCVRAGGFWQWLARRGLADDPGDVAALLA